MPEFGKKEGDVAGGVTRRVEYRDRLVAEGDRVAFRDRLVDARDFCRFAGGPDDGQAELLLQRKVRLDMIAMVMGDQEQIRLPAGALDRGEDRRLLGRHR